MEIKNRYILRVPGSNFTNFSNFSQENPTFFTAPTAHIRTFRVYIGVLAFRSRYIYLRFLTRKTTNVTRLSLDNIYVIKK